jgi:hypothetical protein
VEQARKNSSLVVVVLQFRATGRRSLFDPLVTHHQFDMCDPRDFFFKNPSSFPTFVNDPTFVNQKMVFLGLLNTFFGSNS